MVNTDIESKNDRFDRENFGFSLLPIYSFTRLKKAFIAATWSGRAVYVMTHLLGAIPHFNVILAIIKQIIAGISQNKEEAKASPYNSQAEQISEDDRKSFGRETRSRHRADSESDRCKNDEAVARLMQEVADAEEAKKMQDLAEGRSVNISTDEVEDDLALARRWQAHYDQEYKKYQIREATDVKYSAPKPGVMSRSVPEKKLASRKPFDAKDSDAASQILSTPGLKEVNYKDEDSKETFKVMELCREDLRAEVVIACKQWPKAMSPAALKAQREINLEQYIALELKRFGHAQELKGSVTLPSGKQLRLEGSYDDFAAPWVISSFQEFAERSNPPIECSLILRQFQGIWLNDYVRRGTVENFTPFLQSPDHVGPDVFSIGFDIHCAGMIWYRGALLYLDAGSDHIDHGIYVFHIPNKELITEDFLWERFKKEEIKEKDFDILATLTSELNAELVYHHPVASQIVGNCTYATMKLILKGLLAVDWIEKRFPSMKGKPFDRNLWDSAFRAVSSLSDDWEKFDVEMVFDEFASEVQEWLTDSGTFGQANLKQTYQEVLTYWKFGAHADPASSHYRRVDSLLDQLAKRS